MEAVVGLLVMILGVSHGVETSCDGRKNGTQCFGPLGGTLILRLMENASVIHRYAWLNNTGTILSGRNNAIVTNLIANRSVFTPSNGTFRINDLNWTDGGEYKLQTSDSKGKTELRTQRLTIQVPVSSVLLASECLSEGEMRVSCSSEGGDSPQYSWTLNGHTLTDAELHSGNTETNIITLKQNISGALNCSVRNNVSSVWKEEKISDCGFIFIKCIVNETEIAQWVFAANNTLCIEPTATTTMIPQTSTPAKFLTIVAGILSALVLLLLVGVAVVCTHKRKKNKPTEEDDQELTYADVRILQRPERQMQQRAETEVEYGQVKFSDRPRQTLEPAGDECVYAKVRRGR